MKEWDDVDTSSYWFDVGHDFFMQAKYAESIACLTEAIRLNPDKDLLALSLGLKASELSDLNRNEESFACLDRATKIDPDDIHYLEYCC